MRGLGKSPNECDDFERISGEMRKDQTGWWERAGFERPSPVDFAAGPLVLPSFHE